MVEIAYQKPMLRPDGTPLLDIDGNQVIRLTREKYRFYEGADQLLEDLKKRAPAVRVSFFSGGSHERNEALLAAFKLPDGSRAIDLAYKVKGEPDLIRVSERGRYREKFRKDQRTINSDVENVISIDDINFLPDDQREHIIYTGESFPYLGRGLNEPATPNLIAEERSKIEKVRETLIPVLDLAEKQNITLEAALSQVKAKQQLTNCENALIQVAH